MTLLELQELDSRLDHLDHRRATLPQVVELKALAPERQVATDTMRDARILVDDLQVEIAKAEADVEQVRARRTRDKDRMEAGLVTNPKDLQRMTSELASLERRISTLEDEELEVMERLEAAQGELEKAEEVSRAVEQRVADLEAERDEQFAAIDGERAEAAAGRAPLAGQIPDDLLALYERLRTQKGGVGAALLRARECGGCRLTLDHAELATLKTASPDEVVRCEECQRILVRTDESGL